MRGLLGLYWKLNIVCSIYECARRDVLIDHATVCVCVRVYMIQCECVYMHLCVRTHLSICRASLILEI